MPECYARAHSNLLFESAHVYFSVGVDARVAVEIDRANERLRLLICAVARSRRAQRGGACIHRRGSGRDIEIGRG